METEVSGPLRGPGLGFPPWTFQRPHAASLENRAGPAGPARNGSCLLYTSGKHDKNKKQDRIEQAYIPFRSSIRYKVARLMPSSSAARSLLPPLRARASSSV